MGTLMIQLDLIDTRDASPAKQCSVGLLAWWLQLQGINRTMRGVLRQLPLSVDFSNCCMSPCQGPFGDSAWELLLRCRCPIATLRCACPLFVQEGPVWWVRPEVMLATSAVGWA